MKRATKADIAWVTILLFYAGSGLSQPGRSDPLDLELRRQNEDLRKQIEELRRKDRRSAAPFATGKRKQNPLRPGRKPGQGEFSRRPEPPANATSECPAGGRSRRQDQVPVLRWTPGGG